MKKLKNKTNKKHGKQTTKLQNKMTLTVNIYTHLKQTALSHLNNIYTECLNGYIWFCVFAESKPELGVKAGTLIPNTENLICF